MIRLILKMGDPRLLRVAKEVADINDPDFSAIIADMYETMQAASGIGLAAPQIGIDLRLMVFGFSRRTGQWHRSRSRFHGTTSRKVIPALGFHK
jgi:peptide deformylase